MKNFTFEQRPLSELPGSDLSQWLADFGGDDQWWDGDPVEQAAVLGDHIIVWKDEPLTEEGKAEVVGEYGGDA